MALPNGSESACGCLRTGTRDTAYWRCQCPGRRRTSLCSFGGSGCLCRLRLRSWSGYGGDAVPEPQVKHDRFRQSLANLVEVVQEQLVSLTVALVAQDEGNCTAVELLNDLQIIDIA